METGITIPKKTLGFNYFILLFFLILKKGSENLPASKEKNERSDFFRNKDCYFFKSGGPYAMLAIPKSLWNLF